MIVKSEWWLYGTILGLRYATARLSASQVRERYNLHAEGALYDAGSASVSPCKVLRAWAEVVEQAGGSVRERLRPTRATFDRAASHGNGSYAVDLSDGTQAHARAMVVAVGLWHDEVMHTLFGACAQGHASSPRIVGVAGQVAIYRMADGMHIPPTTPSLFSYGMGAGFQQILPRTLQAWSVRACTRFAPSYFLTSCNGTTFQRYLYGTAWGAHFATGTRREPVDEAHKCTGGNNATAAHARGFEAPGVPYEKHHEDWALKRAAQLYGIDPAAAERVDHYTACFPTAIDGSIVARQAECPGYPRLFVLNGLAGGGIARGPAAGAHVAQLVAAALARGAPPEMLPSSGVDLLMREMGWPLEVIVSVIVAILTIAGARRIASAHRPAIYNPLMWSRL